MNSAEVPLKGTFQQLGEGRSRPLGLVGVAQKRTNRSQGSASALRRKTYPAE